jgi:all-trans-retinol 13,14-reductase
MFTCKYIYIYIYIHIYIRVYIGDNEEKETVEHKAEFEKLREDRSACLWEAIEREIPDVRQRTLVKLVGTPLTHARFNRRYQG